MSDSMTSDGPMSASAMRDNAAIDPPNTRRSTPDFERERRAFHTRLGLFHFCGDVRCKRAQACRGNVAACDRIRGALVPQAVHDFLEAEFELGRLDASDVPADEEEREEVEEMRVALTCWLAGLAAASGLRGRK